MTQGPRIAAVLVILALLLSTVLSTGANELAMGLLGVAALVALWCVVYPAQRRDRIMAAVVLLLDLVVLGQGLSQKFRWF